MRLLIIGKTGQLGSALVEGALRAGHEVHAPGRDDLDITDAASFLKAVEAVKPECVVNTAAFHNVPLCEEEAATAFRVNCIAVGNMAEITDERGAWFVTFSTDYVFDGEKGSPYIEDDMPRPLQMYGISKLAGEYSALARSPRRAIVIRTCGLYGFTGAGSKGGNFVDNRVADARRSARMEISSDQTVSPTFAGDLGQAVLQLLAHPDKWPGIYHLANGGHCTWYEFTREIFEIMGIRAEVGPVDRKGRTGKMRRPLFSALKNTRAAGMGIELPHWKDGLSRYLKQKYPDYKNKGVSG